MSELNITISINDNIEIEISNLLGQTLIKKQDQTCIDISALTKGMYTITITQGENRQTKQFIKE